ncbi:MAG: putative amidase [Pseudolabrys sp.]|jgi:aspartyl-tRNA(Asn)/glutamyl-tRNA(Gln) amidotransferase subunit A|nr:putative amidase [Pseudolabrys sp.]
MSAKSAVERLDVALERIDDPRGEGARAMLKVYRDRARKEATAADERARKGESLGPLDGAIVSIKDLFDMAGEVTAAGSKLIADEGKVAESNAPAICKLFSVGAVIVGRTNMTEFAFSGIGANPHYGTPGNPADRTRIPGGSSSGGAVAVADGMCEITIGSDTGGSTRVPAALCGIVGFKPSKWRISTEGAFPLSETLDSIGPMARTVAECALADAVMSGDKRPKPLEAEPLSGLRIGVAKGRPVEGLDETVGPRFASTLGALEKAGARLHDEPLPLLAEMDAVNAKGGIVPAEAWRVHRERFARGRNQIDPMLANRLERAQDITGEDYRWMLTERARLVKAFDDQLSGFDVLAMPAVPIAAPTIADCEEPRTFARNNAQVLRNTSIGNFFDLTAITLPMPGSGLPCGLMLMARNGQDRRLLAIAAAVERLLSA